MLNMLNIIPSWYWYVLHCQWEKVTLLVLPWSHSYAYTQPHKADLECCGADTLGVLMDVMSPSHFLWRAGNPATWCMMDATWWVDWLVTIPEFTLHTVMQMKSTQHNSAGSRNLEYTVDIADQIWKDSVTALLISCLECFQKTYFSALFNCNMRKFWTWLPCGVHAIQNKALLNLLLHQPPARVLNGLMHPHLILCMHRWFC